MLPHTWLVQDQGKWTYSLPLNEWESIPMGYQAFVYGFGNRSRVTTT